MWPALSRAITALYLASFFLGCFAQSSATSSACPTLSPSYAAPVLADGWEAQLVATGLESPRGIIFDSSGNLLVVESGHGVVNLELHDGGGTCVSVIQKINLIDLSDLNHGIELSNDKKTLYASSSETVFSWSYDATSKNVSGDSKTLVTGMSNSDHTTRTLLISQRQPEILIVSRGSAANIDPDAENISTGHSQIKAFNLSNIVDNNAPYEFTTSGRLLGWGLRNSVGVAEEPLTGGIYSVENSVDQITRDGTDIHEDNPGEEMNFHGFLNSSTEQQGGNYGYPTCFALWDTDIPKLGDLKVGSQFTMAPNSTVNDTTCSSDRVPPRLTFQAHMAPLDIIFTPDGTEAYISFHGSWDRSDPVGYKVSTIAFADGSPVAAPDSKTAVMDIFSNPDNSQCPDSCFRPVGLARDGQGRVFVSSDATGEIWVLLRKEGRPSSETGKGTPTTTTGPTASQTQEGGAVGRLVTDSALGFLCALLSIYLGL